MAKHEIVSPIPGVLYRRPEPDSAPFTDPGQTITAEDTIFLVEVMKSFHHVPAGVSGTIVEFQLDDEDVVEAGQVVAIIEDGQ